MKTSARLLACCLLLMTGTATASHKAVEPARAIPLFLKIVTYDENFEAGSVERVRICVVFDRAVATSYDQMLQIEEFAGRNKGLLINGVRVEFERVPIKRVASIFGKASDRDYNILLATNVGEEKVNQLVTHAREHGFHSFALDATYVPLGIGIGVTSERDASQAIQVNLEATVQEGSKLSAHLLKMCQVWKD